MRAIDKVLGHEMFNGLQRAEAPLREDVEEQILLAHPKAHLGEDARHCDADRSSTRAISTATPSSRPARGRRRCAPSAPVSPRSMPSSTGKAANAFCQVRPPGHHAEADRAMGFCLFSNAAIAGLYARAKHGAERIAIVDFDVHHGNGTQDIFWADKNLFYGSTHEMPLFPGTGAMGERGVGNIHNAPLRAGDGGEQFREAVESRILPALHDFGPDILIVSAGFDAHQADPLANLRLVEADYLWATEKLAGTAQRHCNGRIVSMLEGGYDLNALARSVAVHVKALMDAGA